MHVDIRIIVTLLFAMGLLWSMKTEGDYDFSPIFKFGGVLILYLLFWVVYLAVT